MSSVMRCTRATVGLVVLLVLAACNSAPPGGTVLAQCGVEFASTAAPPSTLIPVVADVGLAEVRVRMVEPQASPDAMPLFSADVDGDGVEYGFVMPFHPESPIEGGSITVEVSGSGSTPCTVELLVESLPDPDAPSTEGTFERKVVALESAIHADVAALGVDPNVLMGDLGSVPPELVPFAFAQFLLDHPENPQDVMDILAQGHVVVDGVVTEFDVGLLDAVFALWAVSDAETAALLEPSVFSICQLWENGVTFQPGIDSLEELVACLQLQSTAADDWKSLASDELSRIMAGLAFTPLAVLNAAILPIALSLMSEGTVQQAKATLLPDSVSIDFGLSVTELEVGEVGLLTEASFTPTGSEAFSIAPFITSWLTVAIPKVGPVENFVKYLAEEAVKEAQKALGVAEAGPYSWSPLSLSGSDLLNPRNARLIAIGDAVQIEVLEGRSYLGEVTAIKVGQAKIEVCPGDAFVVAATGASPCSVKTIDVRSVPDVLVGTFTFELDKVYTQRHSPEVRLTPDVDETVSMSMSITLELVRQGLRGTELSDTESLDGRHLHSYRVARVIDATHARRRDTTSRYDDPNYGTHNDSYEAVLTGPIDSWDDHAMMMLWAPPQTEADAYTNWISFSMAEFVGNGLSKRNGDSYNGPMRFDFGWATNCIEDGGPGFWGTNYITRPLDLPWRCGETPPPTNNPYGYAFDPRSGYSGGYSNSFTKKWSEAEGLIQHTTVGVVTAYWDFESK